MGGLWLTTSGGGATLRGCPLQCLADAYLAFELLVLSYCASSSIIQELLASEQAFVGKLQFLQSHHMQHLDHCPHVPAAVASQKAVIFRNVPDLSQFHHR